MMGYQSGVYQRGQQDGEEEFDGFDGWYQYTVAQEVTTSKRRVAFELYSCDGGEANIYECRGSRGCGSGCYCTHEDDVDVQCFSKLTYTLPKSKDVCQVKKMRLV